jgi:GNAT superfamily N-acetyltransferase
VTSLAPLDRGDFGKRWAGLLGTRRRSAPAVAAQVATTRLPPADARARLSRVSIRYRAIRREEIQEAAALFIVAVTDLAKRHGLQPAGYVQPGVEAIYLHLFETGIFHVAEMGGKIVAICAGVVREQVWFLSMFWVLPDQRIQGIGRPLLEQVTALARARGASTLCTWSSIDFVAIASYLRLGMMPLGPILTFSGELAGRMDVDPAMTLRELDAGVASDMDALVFAARRPRDHEFFRAREGVGCQVELLGKPVGYFYASHGVVGPAAWLQPEHGDAVLRCALRTASQQQAKVRLMIPGPNHSAIQLALVTGLKLTSTSHLMTSAPFGSLERYLPSGPGLF